MLELPEVETIRRELEREVASRRVKGVEVASTKPLSGIGKKAFIDRLEGVKVEGVGRRGLLVTVRLDSGDLLVVDLGSTGLAPCASADRTQ